MAEITVDQESNESAGKAVEREEIILNRITVAGTRDQVRSLAGSAQSLDR